jgi:Eco57I restriction-modification methylase
MNTICVINALNGSLPLTLREKYPSAKITCAEVFPYFREHLGRLGFDVMDWDRIGDMKFDIVIGNPPYQSTVDGSKRKKMWVQFVDVASNLSDVIIMVTPNTWKLRSKYFAETSKFIESHLQACGDANKYFDVGEDIGWWMVDKTLTAKIHIATSPIQAIFKKVEKQIDVKWHYRDFQQPSTSDGEPLASVPTSTQTHPVFWTAKQTRYAKPSDVSYVGWKVIVNNSGHYHDPKNPDKYNRVDNSHAVGLGAWGIKVPDEQSGNNMLTWIRSKLYRSLVEGMKTGGFNNPFVELTNLGHDRPWTDAELYNHFQLTHQEIEYIESYIG